MKNSESLSKLKIFTVLSASAFISLTMNTSNAANFGGVDATPTVYSVTLKKLEFIKAGGGAFTYAEGNFTFDIASVSAGSALGSFAAGNTMEPGEYTGIRITVGRSIGLSAAVADANGGQPCRTDSAKGATGTLNAGAITGVGDGTTDGAAATTQSVPLPTGAAITAALAGLGMGEDGGAGGDMQMTINQTISIPGNAAVCPSISVDFDVTNAAELLTTGGGTCAVFPQPPGVTIAIGN